MSEDEHDIRGRRVSPSVRETAFSCPHCGSLTTQTWWRVYAREIDDDDGRLPRVAERGEDRHWQGRYDIPEDLRHEMDRHQDALEGGVMVMQQQRDGVYGTYSVANLNISRCYNCHDLVVWQHQRMVHPSPRGSAPLPNSDMPGDVRRDYEEADRILALSPRGAAALLRLAIQKLCVALGKPGRNLSADIGALVEDGLSTKVQRALDAVRVIGNESVHPGQIDMRDDAATAESLFSLVNLIVRVMISESREIDEMYDKIPEEKRKAIEARDKRRS